MSYEMRISLNHGNLVNLLKINNICCIVLIKVVHVYKLRGCRIVEGGKNSHSSPPKATLKMPVCLLLFFSCVWLVCCLRVGFFYEVGSYRALQDILYKPPYTVHDIHVSLVYYIGIHVCAKVFFFLYLGLFS